MTDIALWIGFNVFILVMIAMDFLWHGPAHEVKFKEAMKLSILWIVLALLFCLGIYYFKGSEPALNYLTGYLIEKSLSIDNLFVFIVIFSAFATPKAYLHKVLLWGVLSALVMRALFIFTGIVLISKFHWLIYLFGAFLILTGIKLFWKSEEVVQPKDNILLKIFRKLIPFTDEYDKDHFFVIRNGKWLATPLLAVLITIEMTDILFAIDSVPAILAITTDPFIVYTSNVFAILGLRSLYFALSGMMELFHYLHFGLAAVLIFVGSKMVLTDFMKVPTFLSLFIIVALLGLAVLASLIFKRPEHKA